MKEKKKSKEEAGKQEKENLPENTVDEPLEEELQPLDSLEDDIESIENAEIEDAEEENDPGVSEIRPLVVCDESGGFLFLAATTAKGYTKSIEQKALWVNHPKTDRILPSGKEAQLKNIQDRGEYYYAEVVVGGGMDEKTAKTDAGEKIAPFSRDLISALGTLAELEALIEQRKQDNSEGSYTAYLFQAGLDKIRKKTGEEAVELILAREKKDIVYEAADLVYHLLVLLGAEEIPLLTVLEELKTRK